MAFPGGRTRWVALLLALAIPGTGHAAVAVALTPPYQILTPGSDFTVNIDVTSAGTPFNGYELTLKYDPTLITLLPTAPTTAQQGCLMTGACSSACGSTFHNFVVAADSITITDVLLCDRIALTGPGHVYQLRFRTKTSPLTTTQVYLRRATFFNDGVAIPTNHTDKTSIGIGVGLGVDPAPAGVVRMLRVEPNPASGPVRFVLDDDVAGMVEADVVDLLGRLVRHLGPVPVGGHGSLEWDGRDARGARLHAGLYLVRVSRNGNVRHSRVMLLP